MPGSNATFDEAWTQLGLRTKLANEIQKFGNANSPNVVDMLDVITTSADGEFIPLGLPAVYTNRATLAAMVAPANLRALFRPCLLEMGRIIGAPEMQSRSAPSDAVLLKRIRQHMVDNSLSIEESGQTVDTSFTTAGTGNGDWVRMKHSRHGQPFVVGADTITFECVRDQLSGAREHSEVWEARGTDQGDALNLGGLGYLGELTTLHARSSNLLQNGSFDQGTLTDAAALAATTSCTGWTATTAANWTARSSTAAAIYRDYPGAPTSFGLENTASDAITQTIATTRPGAKFEPEAPHVCWVRWKRLSSATGTLTLTLGSQTVTATIGSASNDAWNTLLIPATTTDVKAYYDTWVQQDATIAISTTTLATGTIYIDDAGMAPMELFGDTYVSYIGGSTAALRGATSILADTDGTRGINGYWLRQAYGPIDGHLPQNATPTQADPS